MKHNFNEIFVYTNVTINFSIKQTITNPTSLLLGQSNGQRELNPFCFRRSYLLPFDPYCLSSRMNMWERYKITGGSANEGWLQIRENKCRNKLPLPEIAVTYSETYIGRCILYHPNVFVLVNKCSLHVKLWILFSFFHFYVCHQCVTLPPTPQYSS